MSRNSLEVKSRVLVVDDDDDSRRLLAHLLEREGYDVLSADGGMAALKLLRENTVEVVLLDVMMPKMDGFAVCRELKRSAETALLPVILITAKDDMETRAAGMNLGVSEFLAKPINKNELFERVKTQVKARQRAVELERAQRRADSLG